ncbi:MAG: SpoIIE family protein phosphatase [Planctomycetota bacterium]
MPHPKPIRRTLVTYLSVAVFLLGGTVWGVVYLGERELVERWCGESIKVQLRMADLRLRAFFDPVTHSVELLRELGSQGRLNVDDPDSLEPLFVILLRETPQASAVMLADERGHEYFVLRQGDQWVSRQTRRDEWNDSQTLTRWEAGSGPTVSEESSNYDPRQRPWFRQALRTMPGDEEVDHHDHSTSDVNWTRPYRFFSEKTPGITASGWFIDQKGRKCVVAFDVLLRDLREFTQTVQVGSNGSLAFLDSFGWPIESPEELEATASERESTPPTQKDFARPESFAAVQALASDSHPDHPAISFSHGRKVWWADSQPFLLSAARTWKAVVIVPESDFTGGLAMIRLWVAVTSATALAIAVIWAVRFADLICRPLEALVRTSEMIALGNLDRPVDVASNLQEVGELAAAQERMRTALQALMKLERDMQIAREIQQSTFPDNFPVTDNFQIAGWSEPAEQTGGDTFDVVAVDANGSQLPHTASTNGTPCHAIYLLLADASGHGIGPALSAVRIHSLFRVGIETCESVADIAELINRQMCGTALTGRFATAWFARLDPNANRLDSFSAGQGPILWYQARSDTVESTLGADALPCGVMENFRTGSGTTRSYERGDILAVVSDGIFEATNDQDQQFGADAVAQLLQEHRASSANEILDAIRSAVVQHTGGAEASDDRTMIIVKCVKA